MRIGIADLVVRDWTEGFSGVACITEFDLTGDDADGGAGTNVAVAFEADDAILFGDSNLGIDSP